jgi:hypothetical protein
LPLSINQQFNSHHKYGWNDGSILPSKGYQKQITMGIFAEWGPISLKLQPEFVFAENNPIESILSVQHDVVLQQYYPYVLNFIDEPERFGDQTFRKFFPGQSSIRFNYKNLSIGLSSENLWWGPGTRNSLLMSNTAPGFPHLTFNTRKPIHTIVGSFEGQIIGGLVKGSGVIPSDTFRYSNLYWGKDHSQRYVNGLVATWQPKWIRGLHLGFSRMFYLYKNDIANGLKGYIPIITSFLKKNTVNEDDARRDQLISLFFRFVMPQAKSEIYGELGKNDHSADIRDFILEPEHARAYVFGFRKLFQIKHNKQIEFFSEMTSLEIPKTIQLREQGSWYSHYQVRHGYTNLGQIIGAGIGSGSSSQTIGLNFLKAKNQTGVFLERIVRNNDFYYMAIGPFWNFSSHWVDLSLNFNKDFYIKRFVIRPHVSLINSMNYQWMTKRDVFNLHAQLHSSYIF